MKPAAGWNVAVFGSVGFAIVFVVFGGVSTGYALRSVGLRHWTKHINPP